VAACLVQAEGTSRQRRDALTFQPLEQEGLSVNTAPGAVFRCSLMFQSSPELPHCPNLGRRIHTWMCIARHVSLCKLSARIQAAVSQYLSCPLLLLVDNIVFARISAECSTVNFIASWSLLCERHELKT
jgi:hypothetical protein